jgi:hypothetical protein
MKPNGDTPNLHEAEHTTVQNDTAPMLGIGKAMVAARLFEARVACFLARLHAAEERLMGVLDAQNHVLQDLGVDFSIFRTSGFQVR